MSAKDAPRGPQRVAAFLLSLDQEDANVVLRCMDDAALSDVAAAMSTLDPEHASTKAIDALWRELSSELNGRKSIRAPRPAELESRLVAALGEERARVVLEAIRTRRLNDNPFADIETRSAEEVGAALAEESPSVIATVLGHVDPAFSARVLATFDGDAALEIVRRMATLSPPAPATLRCVAAGISARLQQSAGVPIVKDRTARLQTIAEMLTLSQSETEQTVLQGLGDDDEEMVDVIREFMFTWNDLATVDQRSMQKILASVDTRTLAIALKGSPPDVEQNVMNNLSSRVKDMVKDERELAGALPLSEVLQSRAETMKGVRALMDSGEFKPSRGGEELVQ